MQVRKYTKQDNDKVKDLILSILTKEYPFDKNVFENESDLLDIARAYDGRRDCFFVLETEGKIMGTIGVKEESGNTALIRRLFVDPANRRRGYGALLLEKAIGHCKHHRFKKVIFRTTGRMAQAINLVKKTKFEQTERIDLGGFEIYRFILDI